MITLLIVDDHPIVLEGTKSLFHGVEDITVEAESDVVRVLQRIEEKAFDIYLIDINMPLQNGVVLAKNIKTKQPDAAILLYTGDDITDYYPLILEKKIDGILAKTASKEKIIRTIRSIVQGDIVLPTNFMDFLMQKFEIQGVEKKLKLNNKEKQILTLLAEGHTNKAIAIELEVTQRTAERYLTQLFSLLNVESRAEAVMLAQKRDLL